MIDKALNHRLVLLIGDEEVLRRRALTDLLERLGMKNDDFDLEFFEGGTNKPSEWVSSAGTSPFLAERRVVIVRRLLRADPDDAKASDFKALPPSSMLILVADDEASVSEDRASKLRTVASKWAKIVDQGGGFRMEFKADPKKARETVKAEVIRQGRTISGPALDLLVEMTGGSLSRATSEIEKLVIFTGKNTALTEGDIRRVVAASREWNVFKIADAVVSGQASEAIRQLRILVGSAPKADDVAYRTILPTLARQLRMLWQARICIEARCSPANPTAAVLAAFPEKPNLANEPAWRQDAVMRTARRTTPDALVRCFCAVADADARLKGALAGYTPLDTLEQMVLEMCSATAS
ncbi:MAG: DNA polymerase III subunit delta [Fimbriimonas sp.]